MWTLDPARLKFGVKRRRSRTIFKLPSSASRNQVKRQRRSKCEYFVVDAKQDHTCRHITSACIPCMRAFVKMGQDVNYICDYERTTMLNEACRVEDVDIVCTLLEAGADPALPDTGGRTPMYRAMACGREDMVVALVACGRKLHPTDYKDALRWACKNKSSQTLGFLLEDHSMLDINVLSRKGYTPLMTACKAGSGTCVRMLLAAGADATCMTSCGTTALELAWFAGCSQSLECVLRTGVELDIPFKGEPMTFLPTRSRFSLREFLENPETIDEKRSSVCNTAHEFIATLRMLVTLQLENRDKFDENIIDVVFSYYW